MKFQRTSFLNIPLFVFLFVFSISGLAQESGIAYTKSNNKVILDGKKFYVHIVKKGETLYSLSKLYNVEQDELIFYNPEIKDGLKVNTSLKIPFTLEPEKENIHVVQPGETVYSIARSYEIEVNAIYENNPESRESIYPGQKLIIKEISATNKLKKEDEKYIYHEVEMGETAFSISRKYGLKVKNLREHNAPADLKELKIGQVLKVPKEEIDFVEDKAGTYDEEYYYLKVEAGHTLYSLSKQFKIDIKDIDKANPELKKRELIAGETIRIPILNEYIFGQLDEEEDVPDTVAAEIADTSLTIAMDSATYPCIHYDYRTRSAPFEVGLFLPFYGILNDTLNAIQEEELNGKEHENDENDIKIYGRSKYFIEFYQGALLAIEQLKQENVTLNLRVYDTNNDTAIVRKLINGDEFKNLDLIIGPVYSDNIKLVAEKAKQFQINMVSPLSIYDDFILNNHYAFQVNPSYQLKKEYWLNTILSDKLENVIIIHDGNHFEKDFTGKFKARYFKMIADKLDSCHVYYQELMYFNPEDTIIKERMVKGLRNTVIIPSDDQAFVSDILSKLNTLTSEFNVVVYGMDRWVTFTNIELEYFHNLNIHLFANSFIEYDDVAVNEFIAAFREYYHAEPGKLSFQGYDVAYYFIKALQLFGKEFRFCIQDFEPDLLETRYNFKRLSGADGFVNNLMFTIIYNPDYTRKIVY